MFKTLLDQILPKWGKKANTDFSLEKKKQVQEKNDVLFYDENNDMSISNSLQAVIITAIEFEFNAIVAHISDRDEEKHKGTLYEVGKFGYWRIAVVQIGMGDSRAALETERAIEYFKPSHVFFVGVAGGIKDVKLGDVIAATKVYGYEFGKVVDDGFKTRPEIGQSTYAMMQRGQSVVRDKKWHKWIKDKDDYTPNALVKPIVAGEKVVASVRSAIYQGIRNHYNDAVAVEMEGIGFLTAIHANLGTQGVEAIIIRGISDLLAGKSPEEDEQWQPRAARHAAGFAFAMLYKLGKPKLYLNRKTASESAPKISNLPLHRNRFFTGRTDTLENLHNILKKENSVALYSVALNGIGGVGKTQTAIEYAYRYYDDYQAILWVLGDGEETVRNNFAKLTNVLGLPKLEKQEDAIAAVRNWLNTHDDWLLVIDNAETAKELKAANDLIPPTSRGRRLFTTRTQATGHVAESIEIDCLEEITGGTLLVRRAKLVDWRLPMEEVPTMLKKQDWQTAQNISEELGGLPLAIDQAGAYVEQIGLSLNDYLSHYHDYTSQMLKFESQGLYPRSVYVTFQMALEKVEKREPLAGDVLRMCAFLHPDGIPEELFNTLSDNPLLLDSAIAVLNDYSLVKRIPEQRLLTVHRVVQEVVKEVCDE
ncbi:MAG: NB-ARC domain-containing protein [Thiotrichaceae bacterium]|nr:NB-ARC domain-containing protein [Thiotrichaceae bacterium]